jgi:uncharacterized delta-60 repeat protein
MKRLFLSAALLASIGESTMIAQTAGTLDKTFTTLGYANLDYGGPNERASTVALQADGKIIVIGENIVSADATQDKLLIARIDAKGVKDATFGSAGVLKTDTGDKKEYGRDGLVLSDGKILALSSSLVGTTNNMVVVRTTSAGALDPTFGIGGKYVFDKGSGGIARSMALQSDGKIVVGGEVSGKFLVIRLTANGTLDTGFGASGIVTLSANNATSVNTSKLLIQKDGKILLVGFGFDVNNNSSLAVARFTTTGAVDASYGTNGVAEIDYTGNEFFYCAALQSDDKLVVGGKIAPLTAAKYETFAARLTTSGTKDATFGTTGFYRGDLNASQEEMRGMDIQSWDGKIVMGGFIGDDIGVVRLSNNGALDLTFTTKGFVIVDVPNTTKDQVNAVKIDKSGKIYVAGVINFSSTAENFMVARINSGLVSVFDTDNNKIPVSVFPNPTSNSFSVTYELSDLTEVGFEMYDMAGKKVASFGKNLRNAGKQQELFEIPASITNGLYICRMETKFGATNMQINVVR